MPSNHSNYGATTLRSSNTEETSTITPNLHSTEFDGEFKSDSVRRAALTCIYFSWLFTYGPFNGLMLWMNRLSNPSSSSVHAARTIDMKYIILGIAAFPAGMVMDAWVRKTHVLLGGVLITSVWISALALFTLFNSEYPAEHIHLYYGMLMAIAFIEAFISVALPTLGGDQFEDGKDTRKFYAAFYFFQNVGDMVCRGTYLVISHVYDMDVLFHVGWPCVILLSTTISAALVLVIFCSKWTRQINADSSVITRPLQIMKEAFQRRKELPEGEHLLAAAQLSRHGTFPDEQVLEISKVLKFGLVLICLLPVAFARTLPEIQKCCDGNELTDFRALFIFANGSYAETRAMLGPLITCTSTAVFIPIIHVLCTLLARRGKAPTFLCRFLAGHIAVIIGNAFTIFYVNKDGCTFGSIAVPFALAGVCKALIYVAGYELTLVSAPRSMQGIAMGMYFFLNGVVYCVHIAVDDVSPYTSILWKPNVLYSVAGVVLPLLGMIALILMEIKFELGLKKH